MRVLSYLAYLALFLINLPGRVVRILFRGRDSHWHVKRGGGRDRSFH